MTWVGDEITGCGARNGWATNLRPLGGFGGLTSCGGTGRIPSQTHTIRVRERTVLNTRAWGQRATGYDCEMGAADDDLKLLRRTVLGAAALVMLSTRFDWLRYTQSERTASIRNNEGFIPGRLYVDIYAITGANLAEGIAVFFLGLLAIGGVMVFRHMGIRWAAVVVPLCGLAITGVAIYSAVFISMLAGDVEPVHNIRIGYGLWFIVFAGPLIFAVSSMMALEVFKPKFWTKLGKA